MSQDRDVIDITSVSSQGQGVGRATDGRVIFVPLTAPGDRACIRIVKRQKRHGFGVLEAVESEGEGRVTPRCPLFGECGGCDWQHLSYDVQQHWKRENLRQTLKRIGSISLEDPPVVHGAKLVFGTRTRARMQVNEEGEPCFYQRGSRKHIEVSHCPVLAKPLNDVLAPLSVQLAQLHAAFPLYELRLLTEGEHVVLSVHQREEPSSQRLSRTEKEQFGHWCERLQQDASMLRGCVLYRGNELLASWGEPWVEMGVVPTRYRAEGFAQASLSQNEVLVERVSTLLDSHMGLDNKSLVEVYAGRGNLTLPLAKQGARVLALEADRAAVADAQHAIAQHGLEQQVVFAPFHDQKEVLSDVCEANHCRPHGVLLDPPARGISQELRDQLLELAPQWIMYVSCDAATLARDVRVLLEKQYELVVVEGVDLMPQTSHIEALALLRRQVAI